MPRSSFTLAGLSIPGNSTKILLSPLCRMVGSFVPTSSIRLLIISIDCFNAALFKLTRPNLENCIKTLLSSNSRSNSNLLYSGIKLLTKFSCCLKIRFLNFSCFSFSIFTVMLFDDILKSVKFILFLFSSFLLELLWFVVFD